MIVWGYRIRMVGTQGGLPASKRPLIQRLGLDVSPLLLREDGEVVDGAEGVSSSRAQGLLAPLQGPLQGGPGLVQLSQLQVEHAQVVHHLDRAGCGGEEGVVGGERGRGRGRESKWGVVCGGGRESK